MNKCKSLQSFYNLKSSKSTHKPKFNLFTTPSALFQNLSPKNSISKNTERFLKNYKSGKILLKSSLSHKNLSKKSQIKQAVNQKKKVQKKFEKIKQSKNSTKIQSKQQRMMTYYGNTTTSRSKSKQIPSYSQFQQNSPKITETQNISNNIKNLKQKRENFKVKSCNLNQQNIHYEEFYIQKKELVEKKKSQKILKKPQKSDLKNLEDELEEIEAEYNTLRIRNLLEQSKGFEGLIDQLTQRQLKRLKKIHQTEEDQRNLQMAQISSKIVLLSAKLHTAQQVS